MVEIVKKKLKLKNIPSSLKIVQFSDIHIYKDNIYLIDYCVEIINKLKADLVIFTGDAICSGYEYIKELMTYMKKIECSLGKYYCLGNHDYSDGCNSEKVRNTFKKSDFILLKNDSELLRFNNHSFYIAGLDDIEKGRQEITSKLRKTASLGSIWAVHNPINFNEISKYKPSLMLSGHTHGMQIRIPFSEYIYKKYLHSSFLSGFYKKNDSFLYVNNGIGEAVFNFSLGKKKFFMKSPRINSTPEITLIETL